MLFPTIMLSEIFFTNIITQDGIRVDYYCRFYDIVEPCCVLADGLPITDVADVKANCSCGVKNYHVCNEFYATGSQDVVRLILFWWFMMFMNQHIFDRWCVTTAQMLCGCLFKLDFWCIHQALIQYVW